MKRRTALKGIGAFCAGFGLGKLVGCGITEPENPATEQEARASIKEVLDRHSINYQEDGKIYLDDSTVPDKVDFLIPTNNNDYIINYLSPADSKVQRELYIRDYLQGFPNALCMGSSPVSEIEKKVSDFVSKL